jgi:hypothetical protein
MLDLRVSGCTAHNSLPADWWLPENKSNHCQDHADAASESMRMSHLELLTRPLPATLKV